MPVEKFDTWLSDVAHEMFTLMQHHKGIGLAAPQAGLTERFFVAKIDELFLCLINPQVINGTDRNQMTEGCLSLPGRSVSIERDACIDVAGYTILGQKQFHRFDGLWARAVQHEMDHLNGVLICDHDPLPSKPR
jgi:peptide deformylase